MMQYIGNPKYVVFVATFFVHFSLLHSQTDGLAVPVCVLRNRCRAFPDGYWKGKRVLELGAGTGLLGIAAALLGPSLSLSLFLSLTLNLFLIYSQARKLQ
jgi:hypothetical protein